MNNPLNVHMSMNVPFPTRDQNGNINASNKNKGNNVSLFSFGPNNNASGVNYSAWGVLKAKMEIIG